MSARIEGGGDHVAASLRALSTQFVDAFSLGPDVQLDRPGQRSSDRLQAIGTALAWSSGVIGATAWVGHIARQEWIVELAPSLPPMYPNAALALVAGALALGGAVG